MLLAIPTEVLIIVLILALVILGVIAAVFYAGAKHASNLENQKGAEAQQRGREEA